MRRSALAFLAFLVFGSACSGDRPTLDEGAAREVESLAGSEASSDSSGEDAAARLTLRLAVDEPRSLDPAGANPVSLSSLVVADLLYEGLTRVDDGGVTVGALAERWFISDDRLTWTFVLPADLVDNGGDRLTARDIKRSLERVAARGNADQAATALVAVAGWADRLADTTGGVAGISAADDSTLMIRLDEPLEHLPSVLATPAFGITGERDDGSLRTTGAYRLTDDATVLVATDEANPVGAIELVTDPGGPVAALEAGLADWAVLRPDDSSTGLAADIVRQPLDLEIVVVARMRSADERLGVLEALEPLLLANAVDGLTARAGTDASDPGTLPAAVLLDVPAGTLESLGITIGSQLQDAGVEVVSIVSEPAEFATRVADGDALLFPVVLAGGFGPANGLLRIADPGAVDDPFGSESSVRSELSAAIAAEIDDEQRTLFVNALRRELIEEGHLLPIGRFEVRVALAHRLDGLHHRADGTLDLSEVHLSG